MAYLQLLALFLLSLAILTLIKNDFFKWIIAVIFSAVFLLQLSSVYLTGNVGDYKFYEHLKQNVVTNIYKEFLAEGILLIALFLIITFVLVWLSKKLKNMSKIIFIPILLLSFLFLSFNDNIFYNIYETYSLRKSNTYTLKKALEQLPIDNANELLSNEVSSKAGKNIIFLSLESFEKGFIKERPDLTPFLNKLKNEYYYYDLKPTIGGDWTSASAYMALTGMPAYFGEDGNNIFQGSQKYKLNTLGHVFESAGYSMTYLIANKDFSGINDMLKTFGFEVKSEIDFNEKYERIPWGLHDKDLFNELEKEILLKRNNNFPFVIYASTVATHFPDGLYDERMEGIIPAQKTDLEFMIAAVDHYIGELFKMLNRENLLDSTTVIIVPDHQFMATHPVIDDLKERGLFVLSTEKLEEVETKELFQVSMPEIVLDLSDIQTSAVFLSHLIGDDKNQFIEKYRSQLRDVNVAALTTINLDQGFTITKDKKQLKINILDQEIIAANLKLGNSSGIYKIDLDDKYRIVKTQEIAQSELKQAVKKPLTLTIDVSMEDKISSFFTDLDGITSYKKGDTQVDFEVYDVESKFNVKNTNTRSIVYLDQNTISLFLKSSSFNSKKLSYVKLGEQQFLLDRGINLITVDDLGTLSIENFDTYLMPESIIELLEHITAAVNLDKNVFLVVHDTAGESFSNYSSQLKKLGLNKLIDLKNRQAYIANLKENKAEEFVNNLILEFNFNVPYKRIDLIKNTDAAIANFTKDVDRFIAHAGGKIDGKVYTNSLEALDYNYKKGFRNFELDIIKTVDNHFVAAHDWDIWKEQTGYTGNTPVTLEVFNSFKILDKYTAIDMAAINLWFKQHKDAILITDKTGDVKDFGDLFIDKDRLLMEVFTTKDAEIATANSIKPILSENIINELKDRLIPYMKKYQIEHLAFSRSSIQKFQVILEQANILGYKSYVYHVNFQGGKDEKYVVDYELGKVYGMYADEWEFKSK